MSGPEPVKLTADDLMQERATALPAKEVLSLLDLNVDLDLGLDLAAPIDLAVAANANVAAPIDAAVAANLLSVDSTAGALADQDVLIDQGISGEAIAEAPQTSVLDQSGDTVGDGDSSGDTGSDTGTGDVTTDPSSLLSGGPLLDVDVNVALDADIASPIAGAVAANANVAAPIDAAAAANVLSVGSEATAVADQDAIIVQDLEDVVADATAEQDSTITQ
jgi:hypothetical protein